MQEHVHLSCCYPHQPLKQPQDLQGCRINSSIQHTAQVCKFFQQNLSQTQLSLTTYTSSQRVLTCGCFTWCCQQAVSLSYILDGKSYVLMS